MYIYSTISTSTTVNQYTIQRAYNILKYLQRFILQEQKKEPSI